MLGNRKLVSDTMSEVFDILKPWTDQSFWDLNKVSPIEGGVYIFGRQHFLDYMPTIREMAETGKYIIVFGNSAEGSWTLESQLKQLRVNDLVRDGKILVIGGADIAPEYGILTHEHFLPRILDYKENLAAQQYTDEIFNKTDKPYKFLFLNGRARPHRKYLYERLKRTGALNHALWTMLDSKPTVVRHFTMIEEHINIMATPSELKRLPDKYEVERYRDPTFGPIIPDNCFLKQELFRQEWGDIYLTPEPYVDTYFSLITETVCAEHPCSFRTEKTAKPLAMGHPFIIASNAGFYRDLHNIGFKTFGHVIDESFDRIEHHQDRMDRIVDVVTDLCQQDLASFLKECYTVCKYNQEHLSVLRDQERKNFPDRFAQYINERSRV